MLTFRNWLMLLSEIMVIVFIAVTLFDRRKPREKRLSILTNAILVIGIISCFGLVCMYTVYEKSVSCNGEDLTRYEIMSYINDGSIDESSLVLDNSTYYNRYSLKTEYIKMSFFNFLKEYGRKETDNAKIFNVNVTEENDTGIVKIDEPVVLSEDSTYYIVGDYRFLRDSDNKLDPYLNDISNTFRIYFDYNSASDDSIIYSYFASNK